MTTRFTVSSIRIFLLMFGSIIQTSMSMRVFGNVTFRGEAPESIPSGSYMVVKFKDISLADASSVLINQTIVDAHEVYKNLQPDAERKLEYSINCEKPFNFSYGRFSVSAVINIGWEASGDRWIREGDYYSDTTHSVELTEDQDSYGKDIEVKWYRTRRF